jgi:hypothetical protein
MSRLRDRIKRTTHGGLQHVYSYRDAMSYFLHGSCRESNFYPTIVTGFDNTPRSGLDGVVYRDFTPELFRRHVRGAVDLVAHKPREDRLVFVKSWNEWAEGNYLEPDLRFGRSLLEVLRDELSVPAGKNGFDRAGLREPRACAAT